MVYILKNRKRQHWLVLLNWRTFLESEINAFQKLIKVKRGFV